MNMFLLTLAFAALGLSFVGIAWWSEKVRTETIHISDVADIEKKYLVGAVLIWVYLSDGRKASNIHFTTQGWGTWIIYRGEDRRHFKEATLTERQCLNRIISEYETLWEESQ